MFDYLKNGAKSAALNLIRPIVKASVLKDYQIEKTKNQVNINVANGERVLALKFAKGKLESAFKGKTAESAKIKADKIVRNDYYNDGTDSIKAFF